MHKIISSCFGIGNLKGGGTIASVICCTVMYFNRPEDLKYSVFLTLLVTFALIAIGIITANNVENDWGKDSSKVVIDEIAGMWISMAFVPVTLSYLLIALILFRAFDIIKPLYIRNMEKLPGGTGVMMDDVLAGVYSCMLMQVIIQFNLIPI